MVSVASLDSKDSRILELEKVIDIQNQAILELNGNLAKCNCEIVTNQVPENQSSFLEDL